MDVTTQEPGYARDDASPHPQVPRTPYWPSSPSFPADGLVVESPERFVGVPAVVTEKLDGSNTLLHRGHVYGRGTTEPSSAKWYGMLKKWHAWKTLDDEDYVFGEDIYGLHSIAYDPVPEDATFYIFGVRRGDHFTDWATVEAKANELSIPTVPILHRGAFDSVQAIDAFIQQAHRQPSVLGAEREGVVMRVEAAFPSTEFGEHVCKSVRPDHVQPDAGHWRARWSPCATVPARGTAHDGHAPALFS